MCKQNKVLPKIILATNRLERDDRCREFQARVNDTRKWHKKMERKNGANWVSMAALTAALRIGKEAMDNGWINWWAPVYPLRMSQQNGTACLNTLGCYWI
ncbi:MAG: hypothetical protein ACRCVV_02655 [Shewanella sp.]